MPRYFFHTLDGELICDEEGETLSGPTAARAEALALFGEILSRGASGFWRTEHFSVLCLDEAGGVVAALTASSVAGPALERLTDRVLGASND